MQSSKRKINIPMTKEILHNPTVCSYSLLRDSSPKMNTLSSFTLLHFIPNLYAFPCSGKHKRKHFEKFCHYNESQRGPTLIWTPMTLILWTKTVKIFFKISSFVKTDVRKSAVKSKMSQNSMVGIELESPCLDSRWSKNF